MIPILTLTTDFGLTDHYVGTMKGVILGRCPAAIIVDVCHEVSPFSLWQGAYTIDQAAPFFNAGTTHVVVVDPGVGTSRRAVLVEAIGQRFIAPDNGVLSMILARDRTAIAREITNRDLFLPALSSTFHGRDLFAPVAAMLASGLSRVEDVGPVISDLIVLSDFEPAQTQPGHWDGRVLSVDRFGNVITNFKSNRFITPGAAVHIGGHIVRSFRRTFGDEGPQGECFYYPGSSGFIELAISWQSAAQSLGAAPGTKVRLSEGPR